MAFTLGINAKIYQGPAATAVGALTEITVVKDVTLNMEAAEADITSRANSGWRGTAPALRTATVEFDLIWDTSDGSFDDMRAAFLSSTELEFAVLDGDRGTSGVQGLVASFAITAFNRSEPLEEALTASVTLKLTSFTQWLTV